MRCGTLQFAVANSGKAVGAVIGVVDVTITVARGSGNSDVGNSAAGVIAELSNASNGIRNFVQTAFLFVTADIRIRHHVVAGVSSRHQPRKAVLNHVEAHLIVLFIRNDGVAGRTGGIGQLHIHALYVLVRLRAGNREVMLRAVAVFPDKVVGIVQRLRSDLLVRVGFPAKAAMIAVHIRAAGVVVVVHRNGHSIAGHGRIAVLQHHVSVKKIRINRARASRAHLLVLPPALKAGVRDVIDIHDGAVGGVGCIRRMQLGIVVSGHIIGRTEGNAVVIADARGVSGDPLAVEIRQIEGQPAAALARNAFQRLIGHVGGIVRIEIQPVDIRGFPRLQYLISRNDVGGGAGHGMHPEHCANDGVSGRRNGQRFKLKQAYAAKRAAVFADLQMIRSVGLGTLTFSQRGVLNVVNGIGGVDDGVDGYGVNRVVHEQRINAIFHTDVFAHVGELDRCKRFLASCVVHQRRIHHEYGFTGLDVLYQQLRRIGHFIVERLRQANHRAGQRFGICEDNVLLHAIAHHGVAHRNTGQNALVGVFRLQLGNVAALLLSGFDLGGQIRTAETFHRAADKLRHGLRPRHQAFLLQLCAGAGNCLYGLRLLFEAPRERAAVFGDGGHVAAIHLLREFHTHAVGAVAENLTALRRDGLLEGVVDFLPRVALRITEMDGLGIDYRLMAVRAQIEVLDVFVAQKNLFLAGGVVKQRFQALVLLSLLRETKERLFVALKTIVFHSFSPFLDCCQGCAQRLFADSFRVRLLM